jgi:exopolyphosphatase/guanosine-5'-triphosphate,3'-diphosphate pyrophosphatase
VQIGVVATSAVRDATNGAVFVAAAEQTAGVAVRVLSGAQEAVLSYRGVFAGLPLDPLTGAVLDVGGGSTELIWQAAGETRSYSAQAGAVRMSAGSWSTAQIAAILNPGLAGLKRVRIKHLAGVGGTATTLAAMDQKMTAYDPRRIHGYFLPTTAVESWHAKLEALSLAERKHIPGLQPARADIIISGVEIIKIVLRDLGLPGLVVSESDLLHGLVLAEGSAPAVTI